MNGPFTRLVRAQWAPLVALAVLTLLSALLAVAVPARTAAGYDRAADAAVGGDAVGGDADLRVEASVPSAQGRRSIPDIQAMTFQSEDWQSALPPTFRAVSDIPEASITTTRMAAQGTFEKPRLAYLSWDLGALQRVRYVAGAEPGDDLTDQKDAPLKVTASKKYADKLGYKVGDEITLGDESVERGAPLRVEIAALYEPRNASDPYWRIRAGMLSPETIVVGDGVEAEQATLLLDPVGYRRLLDGPGRTLNYSWRLPIRPGSVSTADARKMAGELTAFRATVSGRADVFPCQVATALDGRLTTFFGQNRTAETILSLMFSGLLAVAAGVLLLAAGLLGERLRPILGTMRARGAALRQIAVPVGGLAALAVLPAAAAGTGLGLLADLGPPQWVSAYAVGILAVLVLVLPIVLVVRGQGSGLDAAQGGDGGRGDIAAARPSKPRLVVEALFVVLAVIGVMLLRRRGLEGQAEHGTDPLIAAAPVLLGVALGLLVLRGYAYPLRLAGRLLRRGRSTVAFVGVARASRQHLVTALPLVVLLLAAAVAGFAATVDTALRHGQERAAWLEVGADAHVAAEELDPGVVARVRAVRGVTGAIPARVTTARLGGAEAGGTRTEITVIAIDLDAYRELAGGEAMSLPSAPSGASSALLSPEAARLAGTSRPLTLEPASATPVKVNPAGRLDASPGFPGQPRDAPYVIVPYRLPGVPAGAPTDVFAKGAGIDAAGLRAATTASIPKGTGFGGSGGVVTTRSAALDALTEAPMVSVVHDAFAGGALVVAAYGLLAVLLVLVVGARARGRTVANLEVLGLSRRQRRGLALIEIAPVTLSAVVAGWVLGLLLPGITGPVVDLRSYTGGHATGTLVVDATSLLVLAGALLLTAVAALAVDAAFDSRRGLGGILRTGD
ncbi:FtsX-like permease family protein [Spirillospora sp. NBC_01491]|uniref:FtsX-like permease family protein n=1 Tax=Spirillospora sp. NBC_01491 TaxID=2976007 RepID=UPI002E31EE85|nr:FtsX-like permease family protein [Spirillospora sp. NBC_01491]